MTSTLQLADESRVPKRKPRQLYESLAVLSFWPVLLLGAGPAGVGLAFMGVYGLVRWSSRALSGRIVLSPSVVFPLAAATVWMLAASLPYNTEREVVAILVLLTQSIPLFLVFSTIQGINERLVAHVGLPLVAWVLLEEFVPSFPVPELTLNPIVVGHICWITALMALMSEMRSGKVFIVMAAGVALVVTPTSGPAIAATAAALFAFRRRFSSQAGYRWAGYFAVAIVICLSAIAIIAEIQNVPLAINNTLTRIELWSQIFQNVSLVGNGISDVFLPLTGRPIGNGHNFVLDSLWVGGPFAAIAIFFAAMASLAGAKHKADSIRALQIGLLVALMFSGAFTSVFAWIMMGIGASQRGRAR